MNIVLRILSFIGLLLTIVPSFLVFTDVIEFSQHTWLMAIGTFLWFISSPFWMNKQKPGKA